MIGILFFDQGEPIDLKQSSDKQLERLLRQHAARIRFLTAGDHDITPRNFNFRNYDYSVTVKTDGCGVLHTTARSRDAATQKVTPFGFTRPSHGDKAYRLPEDLLVFMLGGPNAQRKPVFWAFVIYRPGPSPT